MWNSLPQHVEMIITLAGIKRELDKLIKEGSSMMLCLMSKLNLHVRGQKFLVLEWGSKMGMF